MPRLLPSPAGFTLPELVVTIIIAGIVSALAIPAYHQFTLALRSRTTLDRVTEALYYARMLAVESGNRSRVIFRSGDDGCATSLLILTGSLDPSTERTVARHFNLPGLCLTHSGDSVLVFNSRGMLRPPSRSFTIRRGAAADRLLISIAGRVRRTY